MTPSVRWQDSGKIVLFIGLFTGCCILAGIVRALVAADTLSDLAVVLLQLTTLIAFVTSGTLALWVARRAVRRPARVALRILPIALALVGATFAKTSYADVSVALQALTEKPDAASTTIVVGPSGRDIRLSGDLTEGAAARLAKLLDAYPKITRLHLTSEGGLADEGEAMRKVIAAHGLTTYVPDFCVSACTLAFLGGRERLVMSSARLGFHAPYEQGLFGQTFAGDNAEERAHYLAAGVAPDFIDQAFKVAPDDIWTPDVARLTAAHIVTGTVDRYHFPDSNLDGTADAAGARAKLLRDFPLTRALAIARPKAVDGLLTWYVGAYRQARSEGEIVDGLKHRIGVVAALAMRGADDETLLGFGRFLLAAMEAADSDEACAAIGTRANLIEAESALSEDADAENLAVALLVRALGAKDASRHTAGDLPQATLIAAPAPRPCADMQAVYADALHLPRPQAAAQIRALIAPPSSGKGMVSRTADIVH